MGINALVIGDENPHHEFGPFADQLIAVLPRDVAAEATMDVDRLQTLADDDLDVLIDYVTVSDFTDAQRDGLTSFVRRGGGYVGLHCAADLTSGVEQPDPELRALIGGQFVSHPLPSRYRVHVFETVHPVGASVGDFVVHDEPYQLDSEEDVTVLARMDHPENGDTPVAWAHPYGDGRSFYCSLGHDTSALTVPRAQRLVSRGVRWAAGQLG